MYNKKYNIHEIFNVVLKDTLKSFTSSLIRDHIRSAEAINSLHALIFDDRIFFRILSEYARINTRKSRALIQEKLHYCQRANT